MSRCFPYPPPGYLPSKRDEFGPLIEESMKLRKEKEKAKAEKKKERKREKKDKKRKREVSKDLTLVGFSHGEKGKHTYDKTQKFEKQTSSLKDKYTRCIGEGESSDLTEEHGHPVCLTNPSYSSDNSQNSNKRKRHESPANTIHANGSILKIRLSSSFKHKDKEPKPIESEDVGPSTSGRADFVGQHSIGVGEKLLQEQPCSTSTSTGIFVPCNKTPVDKPAISTLANDTVPKPSSSKMSKVELLYKNLIENWVTPREQEYDDGQDWLFSKKFSSNEMSKASNNAPCSVDASLFPRAQLLPTVDLYALPYTVPF